MFTPAPFETAADCIRSGTRIRILKFGASWCNPCQRVKPLIEQLRARLDADIVFMDVDLDEDSDTYSLLRTKRLVNGIPSLVLYTHGNANPLSPDYVCTGSDPRVIEAFFRHAGRLNTFEPV